MRVSVTGISGETFELSIEDGNGCNGIVYESMLRDIAECCHIPAMCLELICEGTVLRNGDDLLPYCESSETVVVVAIRTFEKVRAAMKLDTADEVKQSALEALTQLVMQVDRGVEVSALVKLFDYIMRRMDNTRHRCSQCGQLIDNGVIRNDDGDGDVIDGTSCCDDSSSMNDIGLSLEERLRVLRLVVRLAQQDNSCAVDALMRYAEDSEHHGRMRQALNAMELEGQRGCPVAMALVMVGFNYNAQGWVKGCDYGLKNCMTEAAIRCLGKVAPLQHSDAIEALLTFLGDEDYTLQLAAGEALIDMEAYWIESVKRRLVDLFAYLINICFESFYKDNADRFEKQVCRVTENMMESKVTMVRLIVLEAMTSAPLARFRASHSLVKSAVARSLKDSARAVRCEAVAALARISKWAHEDASNIFVEMASVAFNDPNEQVAYAVMGAIYEVIGADDQKTLISAAAFLEIHGNSAAQEYLESLQQAASGCNITRHDPRRKTSQRRRLPLPKHDDDEVIAETDSSTSDTMKKVLTCALACFEMERNPCERICDKSKEQQLWDDTAKRMYLLQSRQS